jgi:hypothetical protein
MMATKGEGFRMRWRNGCLVAVMSVALCACHTTIKSAPETTPEGHASWHVVDTASMPHYQLTVDQVASGTGIISRVSPIYPPQELAQCPPSVDVQALLIVDESGRVTAVRIGDEAQADVSRHHYIDAVRVAATQWNFSPLQIDKWTDDPDGTRHLQSHEVRPFSLMYAFHFECHDGRTSTSVGKTSAP